MFDYVRHLLQTNPARFVTWAVLAAVWASTRLGLILGVEVPDDVTMAVGSVTAFIATEVIRRLVYSPETVKQIVEQTTGNNQTRMAAEIMAGSPPAVQPEDLPGGQPE